MSQSFENSLTAGTPERASPTTGAGSNGGTVVPPDPFDPERLRLSQNFVNTGGVRRHVTTIPARKPTREEWFRVNPAPGFSIDTLILELKDLRETYLIAPEVQDELATEPTVSLRRIFAAINRQGGIFIWPARVPSSDGRTDHWAESALEAAQKATTNWVRMRADMTIGAYVHFTPNVELSPPEWPDMTLRQMLKLAYRNNLIDSLDHLILRQLRGEV